MLVGDAFTMMRLLATFDLRFPSPLRAVPVREEAR
jgi:hypothetical protein